MGLPCDESETLFVTRNQSQATDRDIAACTLSSCDLEIILKALKDLQNLRESFSVSFNENEANKVEVPEISFLDNKTLQNRVEEEEEQKINRDLNPPEIEKLLKEDQTEHHKTHLSAEVEKDDEDEKLLKENQTEQTEHHQTVLPSEVEKDDEDEKLQKDNQTEQTEQHQTLLPSEVEKDDEDEKLLKENQTEQTEHHQTVLPSEEEKDDEDEKLHKDNQTEQTEQHQTLLPSEVEKDDKDEKLLKDNKIEQTEHHQTLLPSKVEKDNENEKLLKENQTEQTEQHQTLLPSEVEKDNEDEKLLKGNQTEQTKQHQTLLPSEVEKDKEDEKLLKGNQTEQTEQHQTLLPSEVEKNNEDEKRLKRNQTEQTEQHQTLLPSGVEKDNEDEKLLKENQTEQTEQHQTLLPSEVEKDNEDEKLLKENQTEKIKHHKALLPSEVEKDAEDEKLLKGNQTEQSKHHEILLPSEVEKNNEDEKLLKKNQNENETEKLLKKEDVYRLSDDQVYQVKSSTKGTSSKGEKGTFPADQPRKGSGQVGVSLPSLLNGLNGDEEDDDDGKKPWQTQLKTTHECDDLKKEKKKKKKNKKESLKATAAEDFDEFKMNPIAAKEGAARGSQLGVRQDDELSMVREHALLQPKETYSCPKGGNRMHPTMPTRHNFEAVKRFYKDNGRHTQTSLGQLRGQPASTFKPPSSLDPQDAIKNADEDGYSMGGAAGQDPESPTDGTAALRVFYGNEEDMKNLLERNFQQDQGGVLHCKEMTIQNGEYQEGQQYDEGDGLGRGAFGVVYLIKDKVTKMDFVVKQVPLKKFSRKEALIWSGLEHTHVVGLLGLMSCGDMVYFFSKYHPGRTLQKLIEEENVLGQGKALFLIKQLFLALAWLHGKRVIHKDVKPQNIMVGVDNHVRLIDFGESERFDDDLMQPMSLKGTECYMAPEIARSNIYNAKVDVWSAICTIICAISGDPPWYQRYKRIKIKIFIIGSAEEPPLQDVPSNTDPRVYDFIASGLVIDFRQRPSSAQVLENFPHELVDELFHVRAVDAELNPPTEASSGSPRAICNEPITPCTPRGPETDTWAPQQIVCLDDDIEDAAQNPPESSILIDGAQAKKDIEAGPSHTANPAGPLDGDTNVQAPGPDETDGAQAKKDLDHAAPLLGVQELLSKSLSPGNNQAALSFIKDPPGDQLDGLLELPALGMGCRSSGAYLSDSAHSSSSHITNGSMQSRASSCSGARGNKTSGFRSSTPGVSADICPSGYNSLKTSVTVFTGCSDPIKMKGSSGFQVSEVAIKTFHAKSVQTPFTLVQRKNGLNLQHEELLLNGNFELNAVTAPNDSKNWLWRINDNGRIMKR